MGYGLEQWTEFEVLDVAEVLRRRVEAMQRQPHALELVAPDNRSTIPATISTLAVRMLMKLVVVTCGPTPRLPSRSESPLWSDHRSDSRY